MPYLWTRPRRRCIYGGLIWLLYLFLLAGLWGPSRQSWLAYSEIPLLSSTPMMQGNIGRKTTVYGVFGYLTIDRDSVDSTGALAAGAEPHVQWQWDPAALAWSSVSTIAGALLAYAFIRLLIARGRLKGRCDECGYDLTALQSQRCPECGTEIPVRSR
ncbi:MAG: hypothetical protein IT430_17755 [Phycisphaerales bacterium]|nr:hypothetical protein [Phycisphaerales bacterium]